MIFVFYILCSSHSFIYLWLLNSLFFWDIIQMITKIQYFSMANKTYFFKRAWKKFINFLLFIKILLYTVISSFYSDYEKKENRSDTCVGEKHVFCLNLKIERVFNLNIGTCTVYVLYNMYMYGLDFCFLWIMRLKIDHIISCFHFLKNNYIFEYEFYKLMI